MEKVRIQKYLSDKGVASRRGAEKLVEAGAVTVNGKPAEIGQKVDPEKDVVLVDGDAVKNEGKKRYIMLYKPRGFITTMQDERGRKCVAELVDGIGERVYPIGRLDKDSEGLLLMTNDGDFANRVMHPSAGISKTYRVTVRPRAKDEQLAELSSGMVIEGYRTAPAQVRILKDEPDRTVLQITIHEGRNRQIRKMCEGVGLDTIRLKRVAEGPLKLGMLQPGQWRDLTDNEIKLLLGKSGGTKKVSKSS